MTTETRNPPARDDADLRLARSIAVWLDDRGLDGVLGLVLPGIGDVLGLVFGSWIVVLAIQRGIPPVTIARMLLRIAADAVIGGVPVAGDVFDFLYKANKKNVALLEARPAEAAKRATTGDWVVVAGAALLALVAFAIPIALVLWLVYRLIG